MGSFSDSDFLDPHWQSTMIKPSDAASTLCVDVREKMNRMSNNVAAMGIRLRLQRYSESKPQDNGRAGTVICMRLWPPSYTAFRRKRSVKSARIICRSLLGGALIWL